MEKNVCALAFKIGKLDFTTACWIIAAPGTFVVDLIIFVVIQEESAYLGATLVPGPPPRYGDLVTNAQ